MIKNIAETVFDEYEEEILSEEQEDAESFLNPAENLNTNEPELNICISDIIDLRSPIFNSNRIQLDINNNESEEPNDESNDDAMEGNDYDVNEIVARNLN